MGRSDRTRAMAVAPQPEASECGIEVLQAGGNAVDAAIAMAFVQGVVDPLMCGIAGFGSMASVTEREQPPAGETRRCGGEPEQQVIGAKQQPGQQDGEG